MWSLLTTAALIALTLAAIAHFADRRQRVRGAGRPLQLLPGDIKYESPDGRMRFYFPIATSLVISIVLSAMAWIFR
jgi:hypothetical protein